MVGGLHNQANHKTGNLVSIQSGKTKTFHTASQQGPSHTWTSAILKGQITGPVPCDVNGLIGDEQADRKHHGGPEKAILMYPAKHYEAWKNEYPDIEWRHGGFGENFTITGFDEFETRIGDVFQVGNLILQTSEPRQPCFKLARRWDLDELPDQIIENNRSGWYCRVLHPGEARPGDLLTLLETSSEWTIAEVAYIIRHVGDDFDRAERLYQCDTLSQFIRSFLRKAIDDHDPRKKKTNRNAFFSFFGRR